MAEEPQPSSIHEGAADPHAPTSTAEDRKAAAALSALDASDTASSTPKEQVDGKALDKAMKGLSVKDKAAADADASKKKNVKIEGADVTLLINELEVSRPKATELLRAHDGNAIKAMSAFVKAAP